jgi:hypothetical protein
MNTIEKKEYIKPELEIVEIATEEAIADSGLTGEECGGLFNPCQ